jgi:glutaminyl-peptide cyclotransferase
MKKYLFAILFLAVPALYFSLTGCNGNDGDNPETVEPAKESKVKVLNFNVIGEYPHDTASFTEGLEFFNGKLYESGGDIGTSQLQFGDAKTGKIEKKNKMSPTIFAEGITILNGKLYQLTYQTHDVFVYDVKDITKVIQKFTWPYEGWGMTNNGTDLMITTGGTELYFVDPATFKVKSTVRIHNEAGEVDSVNEIEFVDGFIYGNVFANSSIYPTTTILKINATNGEIVGTIDCSKLQSPQDKVIGSGRQDVFNGIAYNKETKTFFVTGKRWNKMYEFSLN